jgi:hypothetical protein
VVVVVVVDETWCPPARCVVNALLSESDEPRRTREVIDKSNFIHTSINISRAGCCSDVE